MSSIQPITLYTYRKTAQSQPCVVLKHTIPRNQFTSFLSIKNKSLLERHIIYCPNPLPADISSLWQRYIEACAYALNSSHLNQYVDPEHQKAEPMSLAKAHERLTELHTDLFIRYGRYGIKPNDHFLETLTTHMIGLLTMNSTDSSGDRAFAFFKLASRCGHSDAQYHVAEYYGIGLRREQNFERAFHYFNRAADQGHPEALINLGCFYFNGFRTQRDLEKAKHYFHLAAAQNHPLAIQNLSLCYTEKINVPESLEESLAPYQNMIVISGPDHDRNGILQFCELLANAMLKGINGQKNIRCAIGLLNIVIAHNADSETPGNIYHSACLSLAKLYQRGFQNRYFFLKPQRDKAYQFFLKAFPLPEAFYRCAHLSRALIRDHENLIIPINPRNFLIYLMKAADLGYKKAQFELGEIYAPQDIKRSLHYYSLAAAQNHPESINILGCAYYYGTGKKINYKKAFSHFVRAAELGHDYAFASLAICYEHGHGVPKNLETALHYFRCFAQISPRNARHEQLDANCKVSLARAYQTGDAGQIHFQKALQLLTEVTQINTPIKKNYNALAEAHAALADIYTNGHFDHTFTLPIDQKKAVSHIQKAVEFYQDIQPSDPEVQRKKSSFQFRLALLYLTGVGTEGDILPRDLDQYIHYLEQAAINGNSSAQYQLAFHYDNGLPDIIESNQLVATVYYLSAATQNHDEAFAWIDQVMPKKEQNS